MALIGVAGPLATGKSTLLSILRNELPIDSIVLPDICDKVYKDIIGEGEFQSFREVAKDRDYLLIYYGKLINEYTDLIDAYRDYPGLVIFDGTHIDLLIYGMLSLWYHYPSKGVQEKLIHKLLQYKDELSHIYMTVADDVNFKLEKIGNRRYTTGFRQCRQTELYYYDIFRDLPKVITLPSASVLECDSFILDDLASKNLI